MEAQLNLFEDSRLSDFRKNHPLVYHLYRLVDGKLFHVNSIWKDYNDEGYPKEATEGNLRIYYDCKSIAEIRNIINSGETKKLQYIMVRMPYDILKQMPEVVKNDD